MGRPKITVYHNTRKPAKNNLFGVEIRVYYNGRAKYYSTGIRLTKEEFSESYLADRPRGPLKRLKQQIEDEEVRAKSIAGELKKFSFDMFKKMYSGKGASGDVWFQYTIKIEELNKNGQIKTANIYSDAMRSMLEYLGRGKPKRPEGSPVPKLAYNAITTDWLHSYEKWMEGQGCTLATTGIYLRTLRFAYNEAIRSGLINPEDSPFGRGKYIIPQGANTKKALDKKSLSALFNFPLHHSDPLLMARDFFFFSYLCNGINFKDISRLRWKNISGDVLVFTREKTKRTRRQGSQIKAVLNDFAKGVIEKYGSKDRSPDALIFPIIKDSMTEQEKVTSLDLFTTTTNRRLKRLAKLAGVTVKISTYFARHSFSTVARNSGASVEFISESLGHSSIKTTQNYLDSFEDSVKREIAGKLMDF